MSALKVSMTVQITATYVKLSKDRNYTLWRCNRKNQYLKNHMSALIVSMTVQITATYKILPHANLTFI